MLVSQSVCLWCECHKGFQAKLFETIIRSSSIQQRKRQWNKTSWPTKDGKTSLFVICLFGWHSGPIKRARSNGRKLKFMFYEPFYDEWESILWSYGATYYALVSWIFRPLRLVGAKNDKNQKHSHTRHSGPDVNVLPARKCHSPEPDWCVSAGIGKDRLSNEHETWRLDLWFSLACLSFFVFILRKGKICYFGEGNFSN